MDLQDDGYDTFDDDDFPAGFFDFVLVDLDSVRELPDIGHLAGIACVAAYESSARGFSPETALPTFVRRKIVAHHSGTLFAMCLRAGWLHAAGASTVTFITGGGAPADRAAAVAALVSENRGIEACRVSSARECLAFLKRSKIDEFRREQR